MEVNAYGLSDWTETLQIALVGIESVRHLVSIICNVQRKNRCTVTLWYKNNGVSWLVVLRIYVALAVFQPYRDLEADDNQ